MTRNGAAACAAATDPVGEQSSDEIASIIKQKDGYWLAGGGFGYGYPVYDYGYSYGSRYAESDRYLSARPGYEYERCSPPRESWRKTADR